MLTRGIDISELVTNRKSSLYGMFGILEGGFMYKMKNAP